MNREEIALKLLAGFCANPSIFAANSRSGWGLVNCTEETLSEYSFELADAFITQMKEGDER